MFVQQRNRNMLEAAFNTLALIYHVTVNNLRKGQRNAVVGLMMTVVQAVAMILGFYLVYFIIGVRYSPIRGNFIVYIMTGIFMFMAFSQAIGTWSEWPPMPTGTPCCLANSTALASLSTRPVFTNSSAATPHT